MTLRQVLVAALVLLIRHKADAVYSSQLLSQRIAADQKTAVVLDQTNSRNPNYVRKSAQVVQAQEDERVLIVGGAMAEPGDFPWFVATTGGGYCGASLIAPSVVLTAAHCLSLFPLGSTVVVGALQRNSVAGGAQSRKVSRRIRHPNFDDETLNYDILLLQLDEPVNNVDVLRWNKDPNFPSGGEDATVMGFGRIEYEVGATSQDLLWVNLKIVPDRICFERYGRRVLNLGSMVCAMRENVDEKASACQGDSGGPLVTLQTDPNSGQNYALQVGVVSWGINCNHDYYPGVYARLSGVADWMETTICDLSPGCNSTSPSTTPPPTTPKEQFTLYIIFQYDRRPWHTTWELIRVFPNGQEESVTSGPPEHPSPNDRWQYKLDQKKMEAGSFRFVVYDSFGDGLQTGAGFQISVETPTLPRTLLVEGPLASFSTRYSSDVFDVPPKATTTLSTPGPSSQPATTTTTPSRPPQTVPTSPTLAPSYARPCVCLAGPVSCREEFCSEATDQKVCQILGCAWVADGNVTAPPNIEEPQSDGDVIFPIEQEMTDLQKAGFSLLVGLAAAVATFLVLGGFTMLCCKTKESRTANEIHKRRSPNTAIAYPAIQPRGTETTQDFFRSDTNPMMEQRRSRR